MALSPAEISRTHDRAAALHRQGRLVEAERLYRQLIALAPAMAGRLTHSLALVLLSQGRYAEAWPLYEARFHTYGAREPKPRLSFPECDGRPVGSLLIWGEQGFGDRIQMARFVPVLAARGIRVTHVVPKPLAALFVGLGADLIVTDGEVTIPPHDAFVMSGSLPYRLGVTLETLPAQPYLAAPSFRIADPATAGRIGLVARGDPRHHNDAHRSLDPAAEAILRGLSDRMIDLDPAATGARDFADTAAILARLALVVTVDTSVAHLAGAMGKPTWILLPDHDTDWRWMRGRPDSPWYPTARLFRQASPGDWRSAIAAVAEALAAFDVGPPT